MPKYKTSPTIHSTPFLQHAPRMASRRRARNVTIAAIITVLFILYYISRARPESDLSSGSGSDFYHKTKNALDHVKADKGKVRNEEDKEVHRKMSESLREAAQVAKDNANAKAPKPDPPSSLIGVGSAAQGAKIDREAAAGGRKKADADAQTPISKETKEDQEVEAELNSILKRAPIIIFSKSYCPHSKRAKSILLEKYDLNPKPYVVELDKHPLGLNLQHRLAEITHRGTVPNILINGVSIGGGDEVAELDATDKLIGKIMELGGKRVQGVGRVWTEKS